MKNIDLFRHSSAKYDNIGATLKKDPTGRIKHREQIPDDLLDQGKELAKAKAKEYFDNADLNPETDVLFFVSSNEARAIETANAYRQEAHARGFEVVKHEREIEVNQAPGSEEKKTITKKDPIPLAQELGEGEIRTLQMLSLNTPNMLHHAVFIPDKFRREDSIDWSQVSPEDREMFEAAKKIVNERNAGSDEPESWGSNFFHHSEAVADILPGFKSVKDLYDKRFQSILKLVRFAEKKMAESGKDNVKVMAFGHENYLAYALEKYFGEHNLGYCEAVSFDVDDDDGLKVGFRGEERGVGQEE